MRSYADVILDLIAAGLTVLALCVATFGVVATVRLFIDRRRSR